MTIETLKQKNDTELMETFSIGKNAAEALGIYLLWISWGEGVELATDAASDFIDTEQDIDDLQWALAQLACVA